MAHIRVTAANGTASDVTGEWKLLTSGVLVVKPEDGETFILSAAGWLEVKILDKVPAIIHIGELPV